MYFNGHRVKIENIEKIFSSYSLDIQDEVRSMVLDGLDLVDWVPVCKDNPYRLNQIRLASKEGVDPRFFSISDGSVLYGLRKYLNSLGSSDVVLILNSGHISYHGQKMAIWISVLPL